MATKPDNDEESFIILGSSPGTSLDVKYNSLANGDSALNKINIEEAMKDMSLEASMALKAHLKLDDCPSPASMMVASTIVSDDKSTEELQKHFGELLDENVILKDTLKQNNDSMKEQFLLIASCQEDMMRTHQLHKEKFDETRELVERLRQENKKLKQDIVRLVEMGDQTTVNIETGESNKSGPFSALEFVTSPEDDTVNKLTAQLDLVEKQRRQVITENEKLTWQKESLENIVDATTKERDSLKEKVKDLELHLSTKENDYVTEVSDLKYTIQNLQAKVHSSNNISAEEIRKRDMRIQQLDSKLSALQTELKTAQLKILELENVKLEFMKHKSGVSEMVKMYKEQIQDVQNRLKEAQTTVFQPIRISISSEGVSSSQVTSFQSNVKLYDRTLKHIGDLLSTLVNGTSDSLIQTLGLIASLQDFKLDRTSAERFKAGLVEVKLHLEKQHSTVLDNIGQVRSMLSIFEDIFKDYNEMLKKVLATPENGGSVETLTAALVARGQELQVLREQLAARARPDTDHAQLLAAQLDLYKSDFEAEREAREKMASEKETIMTDLRLAQKRNQELTAQLEEVRKLNPGVYQNATKKRARPQASAHSSPSSPSSPSGPSSNTSTGTTGNTVRKKKKLTPNGKEQDGNKETTPPPLRFDCPVCDQPFKTLILLQQHVDTCLL